MAVLTVDDMPVASGTVRLPLVGRPSAILELPALNPPFVVGQRVKLRWSDGQELVMSVDDYTLAGGVFRGVFIGGRGLDKVVQERYYRLAPVSSIARAIITEAGETPGEIDAPETLPRYVRRRAPAHVALNHLTHGRGVTWRVLEDGRVWVGKASPVKRGPYRIRSVEGSVVVLELAPELRPGDILEGLLDGAVQTLGLVTNVIHHIDGETRELRTEAYVRKA